MEHSYETRVFVTPYKPESVFGARPCPCELATEVSHFSFAFAATVNTMRGTGIFGKHQCVLEDIRRCIHHATTDGPEMGHKYLLWAPPNHIQSFLSALSVSYLFLLPGSPQVSGSVSHSPPRQPSSFHLHCFAASCSLHHSPKACGADMEPRSFFYLDMQTPSHKKRYKHINKHSPSHTHTHTDWVRLRYPSGVCHVRHGPCLPLL